MLEINKTITLNGTSTVNGQIVVNMHASLSTDGKTNGNINKNITNLELYNAHKTDVRADMAEFETEVYLVEDELNTVSRKVGK
ncbi:hypothetical protein AALJ34_17090 [Paraclostridium bifermentans]|uniref:hypothetical protein n=1 Tax=Paraclostridium bifermentans TaxID=1490 RepID=UPI001C1106AF|nr:hypothetical protein [Paraclostridium bifermentans]MBU5289983.1 hypothetical protein [Paraclostridium bifermentans]